MTEPEKPTAAAMGPNRRTVLGGAASGLALATVPATAERRPTVSITAQLAGPDVDPNDRLDRIATALHLLDMDRAPVPHDPNARPAHPWRPDEAVFVSAHDVILALERFCRTLPEFGEPYTSTIERDRERVRNHYLVRYHVTFVESAIAWWRACERNGDARFGTDGPSFSALGGAMYASQIVMFGERFARDEAYFLSSEPNCNVDLLGASVAIDGCVICFLRAFSIFGPPVIRAAVPEWEREHPLALPQLKGLRHYIWPVGAKMHSVAAGDVGQTNV